MAKFWVVCFLTFTDSSNIFWRKSGLNIFQVSGIRDQRSENRDQGSGIRDQGSGIRVQGSGNREQETLN